MDQKKYMLWYLELDNLNSKLLHTWKLVGKANLGKSYKLHKYIADYSNILSICTVSHTLFLIANNL